MNHQIGTKDIIIMKWPISYGKDAMIVIVICDAAKGNSGKTNALKKLKPTNLYFGIKIEKNNNNSKRTIKNRQQLSFFNSYN